MKNCTKKEELRKPAGFLVLVLTAVISILELVYLPKIVTLFYSGLILEKKALLPSAFYLAFPDTYAQNIINPSNLK